jgi:effector-binding domain-containing protein
MIDTPQIVQTKAIQTAAIHITVPRNQIQTVMMPGLREVHEALKAQGIEPAGPWLTHHLKMDPGVFDFEIMVPVTRPVTATGRVRPGELPATTVARTVYHGGYEGLGGAWPKLDAWIAEQGRTGAPSLWEVYLTDPSANPDPSTWRTELNRPLVG